MGFTPTRPWSGVPPLRVSCGASPAGAFADGTSTSTITVTLLDANGYAVAGKDVTLANTAGPQAAVIAPLTAQATDVNGEATFTVSSSTVGAEEFTATDVTDGNLVITQTASVNFVDSASHTLDVNVNFNGFTGNPDPGQIESTLEGPAGGLGTSWNQFADEDSAGPLVDTTGILTTVEFTTNFSEGRYNGTGPSLTMLRAALTDFGRGATRNLTITLTYDLVTGGSDYETWAAAYLPDDVSDPGGDFDGDALSNEEERVFGLDPTDPSSVNPFTVPLDAAAGTFSYTRRDPALSGLSYTIWTSTDLQTWTEDVAAGASQVPGAVVDEVQPVAVTLTAAPVAGKLFVQVRAN